jgi:hypothetical protein
MGSPTAAYRLYLAVAKPMSCTVKGLKWPLVWPDFWSSSSTDEVASGPFVALLQLPGHLTPGSPFLNSVDRLPGVRGLGGGLDLVGLRSSLGPDRNDQRRRLAWPLVLHQPRWGAWAAMGGAPWKPPAQQRSKCTPNAEMQTASKRWSVDCPGRESGQALKPPGLTARRKVC